MIFYLATQPDGRRLLKTVKTEAAAIDKEFETLDIPTDKPGLMATLQELLTLADDARLSAPVPVTIPTSETPEPAVTEDAPKPVRAKAHPTVTLPSDGDLTTTEQLELRRLIDQNWEYLPFAYRCDLTSTFFNHIRLMKPQT